MGDRHATPSGPERTIGAVVLCIGLAALAVLAFAARRVISLERAVDAGDVVVLSILAAFAGFCALTGWYVIRLRGNAAAPSAPPPAPPRRITIAHGCAAAGVLLLIASVLVPPHWQPAAFLFGGLALLAVSHGLNPCVERLEQLRKARASERQL